MHKEQLQKYKWNSLNDRKFKLFEETHYFYLFEETHYQFILLLPILQKLQHQPALVVNGKPDKEKHPLHLCIAG